ncbi:MAG: polyamine ABC transporter substrate-binding protein [Proteobacteria bacterium]|nr:polyamine ABC transporter substrate-binding protein [Pseudomonadota bacterium]
MPPGTKIQRRRGAGHGSPLRTGAWRRAALAGAALAACLGTAGCQRHDAGQPEEKVLHVYNWADYIGKTTIEEFERRTGIKVVYDTYDSDETLEAKMMAGDSGYDVVSTSTDFFSRQIRAGIYRPLDRKLLPNWKNLDPAALAAEEHADPGNRYAMPYLHHVNGFSYNVDMIRARMPDAPVDSLDMLFKPQVVRRFVDCGVTLVDGAEDVLQLALNYLGLDPNSKSPQDYARAEQLLDAVRPYIKAFDSSEYMNGLANGEFCLSMSWSADYSVMQARARHLNLPIHLAFTIPKEGANEAFDALLIPADAPHPLAAHRFLNFILEPRVIAAITNDIHYANNNLASRPFVDPQILNDPVIYLPREVEKRLYVTREADPALQRLRTRTWMRIKYGR